jgi:hypothetical protein
VQWLPLAISLPKLPPFMLNFPHSVCISWALNGFPMEKSTIGSIWYSL